MKIDIKICGLKTEEAVEHAVALGATHVGFIFFEKSPRYIEPFDAGKLADSVRGRAKIVTVMVDPDNDTLDEIIDLVRPDILQLHGSETADRVLNISAVTALPVIKAMTITSAEDLRKTEAFEGLVSRFLFDAKAPKGSQLPGGNGVTFDWSLLKALDPGIDYFLSGGLNINNVGEALSLLRPKGIDLSSGVESAPGVKDLKLMDLFFETVHQAIGRL